MEGMDGGTDANMYPTVCKVFLTNVAPIVLESGPSGVLLPSSAYLLLLRKENCRLD